MSTPFPRRAEVHTVDFGVRGGRLSKRRPALIVQNDRGNAFSSETIVVAIRHAGPPPDLPISVRVPAGTAGLHKESVIDCGQVLTIDKDQLGPCWGSLPPEVMARVDQALRISLGL